MQSQLPLPSLPPFLFVLFSQIKNVTDPYEPLCLGCQHLGFISAQGSSILPESIQR